ncbi:LysM peptidoglycan-binding domain-containing protein [Microvirga solisilvae]|uniref:LysM peptidoglycan-binding domain-containing protein n=1 Tax=Microvirga solisilvae TaxID=2919498 RepID=UPI001FAED6DC|nr:LysM peptidoglycan-binding domain-containing protein [Microvirga solisilvae]
MAQATEIKGTIAILGAAAAGIVAVLIGALYWAWPGSSEAPRSNAAPQASVQQPAQQQSSAPQPMPPKTLPPKAPEPKAAETKPAQAPIVPSFDLVRIEPNGESVIAGRAAPGATIELMRGDQVHARGVADASGLFAIVPPALPPGSHQVVLQSIAPDGARQRSQQTVTVVIDATQNQRPLVTLTTPDQPTVVLSNPEPPAPEPQVAQNTPQPEAPAKPEEPSQPTPQQPQQQANATPEPPAQPAPRPEIKIVSVESENGKLFVSGQSAPGATVRLYLNETLIAPGGAGGDGKVSFSIGSGVRPGDYRIRLDDVDPVSGQVKSRAEVGFNVPAQVAATPETPAAPEVAPQAQTAEKSASEAQVAAAGTVVIPNISTAIISKGDNLWRISQRLYGSGYRYTVIYGANKDQIRNPNLIYPGQVFVVPNEQEQKTN